MSDPIDQEIRILRAIFWSERDPEGRAFVPLADAYLRKGSPEEALSLLEDGLARHPDFASAHLVAARVHRALGQEDGVEAALATVLTLDPANAPGLRMRGELAEGQGDREGAIAAFREALARNPGYEDLEGRVERLEAGLPLEPFHLGPRDPEDPEDPEGEAAEAGSESGALSSSRLDAGVGGGEVGEWADDAAPAFEVRDPDEGPGTPEALDLVSGADFGEGEPDEPAGWEFPEIDFPISEGSSAEAPSGMLPDLSSEAGSELPSDSSPEPASELPSDPLSAAASGSLSDPGSEPRSEGPSEPPAGDENPDPLSFEPGVFGELLGADAEEGDGVDEVEAIEGAEALTEAGRVEAGGQAPVEAEAEEEAPGTVSPELGPDGLVETPEDVLGGTPVDVFPEEEASLEAEGGEEEPLLPGDPFDLAAFPSDDPDAYPVPGMAPVEEEEVLAPDLIAALDPVTPPEGEEEAPAAEDRESDLDLELASLSFEPREETGEEREPRLSDDLSAHEALAEAAEGAGGGKGGGTGLVGDGGADEETGLPLTRTLGELYARQGLREEALRVFRRLAERSPEDTALHARIEELEGGSKVAPPASPDGAPAHEARASSDEEMAPAEPATRADEAVVSFEGEGAAVEEVAAPMEEEGAAVEEVAAPMDEESAPAEEVAAGTEEEEENLPARLARRPVGDYFQDLMSWSAGAVPVEELSPEASGPPPGAVGIAALAPGAEGPPPPGVPSPLHPRTTSPEPDPEPAPQSGPQSEPQPGPEPARGPALEPDTEPGPVSTSPPPAPTPPAPPAGPPAPEPARAPEDRSEGRSKERPTTSSSEAFEGLDDFQDWLRSLNR